MVPNCPDACLANNNSPVEPGVGAGQSLTRPTISTMSEPSAVESCSMYLRIDSLQPEIVVTPSSSSGVMKCS
jgi:hypothetical protein